MQGRGKGVNLISLSGGKDSTATLLLAVERDTPILGAVFCDTGNEHPLTYEYVDYLEHRVGVPIKRLRQDFTNWWWRRRDYVRDKWSEKGVPDDVIQRALAFYEQGPTGNPYLDLCVIKNRFPSRRVQFCTELLKTRPATEYALDLIEQHGSVVSWQGVRAEESPVRAKQPMREDRGGGYHIYRPILHWTAAQVFDQHRRHNVEPNPLYKLGMGRVGCMPCINARKGEILEISRRFPEQIDRIEEWERIVGMVSKLSNATFFPAPGSNEDAFERGNVRAVVRWAATKHGGIEPRDDLDEEPPMCASAYGLCE